MANVKLSAPHLFPSSAKNDGIEIPSSLPHLSPIQREGNKDINEGE